MKLLITERQFKNVILEYYDSEKLYLRDQIVSILKRAPKQYKQLIDKLPSIDCENSEGEKRICTKISEFIYVYLMNRH